MEYIEPKPREEKPHAKRNKIIIASVAGALAVAAIATTYTLLIKNVFRDYKNIEIFTYSYATDGSSSGVTITGVDDTAILPAKFRVPSRLSGQPVVAIADDVFSAQDTIEEVIFPDSLESIGERCFAECTSLKKFNSPKSLKKIGKDAFAETEWLEGAEDGEVAVGTILYAYKGEMDMNSAVVSSEDSPMASVYDNIIDLSKYTAAASGAFKKQDNLVYAELPEVFTEVADSLFEDCSMLQTVDLGDHIKTIGNNAFNGCVSLTSIDLPESIEKIGDFAFAYSKLTGEITLGSHVQEFGMGVFEYAREITKVNIPYGFDSVPDYTFEGCEKLTEVTFDAKEYDAATSKIAYIGASSFKGTAIESLNIPFNVNTIKSQAFAECPELLSISIYNNVTGTKQNVHVWNEEQEGYVWEVSESSYQGINVINEGAFKNSPKFNAIRVSTNGTLSSADEVNIPVTLIIFGGTNSDSYLFTGTAVETINMSKNKAAISADEAYTSLINGSKLSILPPTVCEGATKLANITFSEETVKVNRAAFKDCTSLVNVVMPGSITDLGTNMFQGCTALETVSLSTNAQSVPASAFEGCIKLDNIVIPESVKTIGDKAFKDCSSLSSFATTSVTNIGSNAFENCTSLTSVNLGTACNQMANEIFKGCTSLTNVTFSSNARLASVKAGTFSGNTSLTSIVFDENIQRIETLAFEGCTNLATVTLKSVKVVTVDAESFKDCGAIEVRVPSDLVDAYKANATWAAITTNIVAL